MQISDQIEWLSNALRSLSLHQCRAEAQTQRTDGTDEHRLRGTAADGRLWSNGDQRYAGGDDADQHSHTSTSLTQFQQILLSIG